MQYDPFQKQAIDYINQGLSVIVSAPTGSGKTAIAEHVIEQCLKRNEKIIYTSPIKALSNQKFRDFQKNYPNQVGILTGDVNINPDASTLIMTTEIFRNKIIEEKSSLKNYTWIIFDEIHYLDDIQRGSVWEESLIFLPDHMRVLGLSATIPNITQFAKWLEKIHNHKIKIVEETKRPVPLHFFFQCQGEIYDNLKTMQRQAYKTSHLHISPHHRIPKSIPVKPNRPISLIKSLQENNALPCVYFTFSRKHTQYLAEEMRVLNFLTEKEHQEITAIFDDLCAKFDITHEPSTYEVRPLIERGIAYHHAGMLPTLKEVIERLFTTRLIKVIFTTETFALGINMPAKTVVFNELKKYYERSFRPLKTRDFYQMAGRAGRRSIDKEGYVFCRVNPHELSINDLEKILYSEPEKITSRFNASYATILNLYAKFGEKLYDVYPKSFHHFQEKKQSRWREVKYLKTKVAFLRKLGYIQNKQLTIKGQFACNVYGYEMILSELFAAGILEELSDLQLAVLGLAIVYEPRKGMHRPPLTKEAQKLLDITYDISLPIIRTEKDMRITPLSKICVFHLSASIEGWMRGENFNQILQYVPIDEGELVRYFRMTIQVLREVLDAPVSKQLKTTIRQVLGKINRDVIDAEKQLRI